MWRCWVCNTCKIVSYHPITYCPTCPNKMDKIIDTSINLQKRFREGPGEYTPYEYDKRFKQSWAEEGFIPVWQRK